MLTPDGSDLHLIDLATDCARMILEGASPPVYLRTGHITFRGEDGGLYAAPFGLERHAVTGARTLLREDVRSFRGGYDASRSGTLVFTRGMGESEQPGRSGGRHLVVLNWFHEVEARMGEGG